MSPIGLCLSRTSQFGWSTGAWRPAPIREEKDAFDIVLSSSGDKKIEVLKVVREVTGLGLKEAKDLVDGAPKPLKNGVKKDEAESIKKKVEAAGGKVELK